MRKISITIAFLGNINYDTRTFNLYKTLVAQGYDVSFIGFEWRSKSSKKVSDKINIYPLHKRKFSLFFYLKFAFLLSVNLYKSKSKIFFAEDLQTLPFVFFFAKIKRGMIYYDSRELFGFLAGLKERSLVQFLLKNIEKAFITGVNHVITTGEMDAAFLRKQYRINNFVVIRNLPIYKKIDNPVDLYEQFKISRDKKILIYQGVIFHGRGLKSIFGILKELPEVVLVILGRGEYENDFFEMVKEMNITDQVVFGGNIQQDELLNYTAGAYIGLAMIENVSLSYYYALPNKLFEYILAGIPVIVSNLPQMDEIVKKYNVGFSIEPDSEDELKNAIKKLCEDETLYSNIKNNCLDASKTLNWDIEIKKLLKTLPI